MKESLFNNRIPVQCASNSISSILTCDISFFSDELIIRLIDTNDIFKFYQCRISGASYITIKNEQELRVSFEIFIKKVVELFYQIKKNTIKALFSKESLRFIFIEQNEFKNIIRLELKFNVPDDNDYKRYLAEMISNLEMNNTKLYKENIQIKETIKNIEKETKERVFELSEKNQYLSEKNYKYEKLIETLQNQNKSIIEEREKESKRLIEIEKENSNLKYEIEKIKINGIKMEQEIKRNKEIENDKIELEKENKISNEIIKKMKEENKKINKLIEEKDEEINEIKEEKDKNNKFYENYKKQLKEREEKIRKLKESLKAKEDRIRTLEVEKKQINKKMEDAKFVYNHFYGKKEAEQVSDFTDRQDSTFNFEPESPPR